MTSTKGLGTYGNAVGTVTPLDHKMAQLGPIVKTAENTIRAGLFWDGNTTIVSGKANMSYDVRALSAVLSRGATAGAVLLTNDAVYNVVTTAAPGSNSRYDVVYLWQREYSLDGTDSNPVIGVVQGTAAASPTVPSLAAFPGAIELARILVPSGVTATNSGTTITQTGVFTAAAGGVIPFRNTTERDAGTYKEGQLGWLLDTDAIQQYNGTAWLGLTGLVPLVPTVSGSGVSVSSTGLVTFSAASSINVDAAFTSTYRDYLVKIDITGASTTLTPRFQLRASSSTDTGASNYGYEQNQASGTGTSAANSSGAVAFWRLAPDVGTSTTAWGKLDLLAPQVATPTRGLVSSGSFTSTAVQVKYENAGYHNQSAAYDGFTISTSTGNITGTIRIYGYA